MQSKAVRLPIDLEDWCRSGRDDLIDLDKKLKAQGTSLRLEVLNLFKIGRVHFGYFDKVLARLHELNDLFTIEDWNTVSNGRNFFYTVCSSQAFPAVMNYKIWVGRAAKLKELWDGVDARLRNGNIVSTATLHTSYENNYGRHYTHDDYEYRVPYNTHTTNSYLSASRLEGEKFTLSDNATKEDLFTATELGATPLDDPRTWAEIKEIMEFFRKKGTPVTKADFLRTNAASTTYFERAEHFAAARAVRIGLRAQGEKLVLADITDPNFKKKFEWNVREFRSRTEYSNDQKFFRTLMIDPDHFVSSADSNCLCHLVDEGAYPVSGNNLASAALNGELFKAEFIMSKLQQLHKDTPEVILEILNTEHDVKHPEHNNSFTATALKAVEYYYRSIKGPDRGGMIDLFTRVNNKALEDLKKKLAPENWVWRLKEQREFAEQVRKFLPDFDFEKTFRQTFELTYGDISKCTNLFTSTKDRPSPLEFGYGWEALANKPQIPVTRTNLSAPSADGEPLYYTALKIGAIDSLFCILRRANIRLTPEDLRYQGSTGTAIGVLGKRKACDLPLEGLDQRTQLMLLHESGISNDQIVSNLDRLCGIASAR